MVIVLLHHIAELGLPIIDYW